MANIRAGKLDKRIEIISVGSDQNEVRELVEVVTVLFVLWGDFNLVDSRPTEAGGMETNLERAYLKLRYKYGIETVHKVRVNGFIYDIDSVQDREQQRKMLTLELSRQL